MTNEKQVMAVDKYFPKGKDKRRGEALAVYAEGFVDGKIETEQIAREKVLKEILESGCWLANTHNMSCPIREKIKKELGEKK